MSFGIVCATCLVLFVVYALLKGDDNNVEQL